MTKSVTKMVAEWMCDEWGEDDEKSQEFMPDARDLLDYLAAHNVHVSRRPKMTPKKMKGAVASQVSGRDFTPRARAG